MIVGFEQKTISRKKLKIISRKKRKTISRKKRKINLREKREIVFRKKREIIFRKKREINSREKRETVFCKDHESFRADTKKPIIATYLKLTKENLSRVQRKRTVPILYV